MCTQCENAKREAESNGMTPYEYYDDIGPNTLRADRSMGHIMHFTKDGAMALCIAKKKELVAK